MKPWLPGRAGIAAMLIAAIVTFSACGPSPSSADPAGPFKINLGVLSPAISHTPIHVAMHEGFFAKVGLDVSVQQLSGGTPAAMAAFATGSVNLLYAGATEFIEHAAKKVIFGKIAGECADATFDIVVTKGITRIEELKGKTLGISGPNGADQIYFEAVLQHYGMSAKDVTFVASGGPMNRLTALSAGAVQAIAASNSNRDASSKVGTVLLKSNDSPIQLPGGLFFANEDMIANRRTELKKFMTALGAATTWLRANPAAAAGICAQGAGLTIEACASGIAALTNQAMNSKFTWSSTYAVNTEGIQAALELEAIRTPESKGLTVADLVDATIAGTVP